MNRSPPESVHDAGPGARNRLLLVAAAPAEARAILAGLPTPPTAFDLHTTGVGKVNAAIATLRAFDPTRHVGVINLGICGLLPPQPLTLPPPLGSIILADLSLYADEGAQTPGGFITIADMGFPPGGTTFPGMGLPPSPHLLKALTPLATRIGPIATVSTCSGTDSLALDVARRTGAIAEAMEGAAIAHALALAFGPEIPFAEIRVLSNTTGDRSRQVWDLPRALAALTALTRAITQTPLFPP